MWLEFGSKQVFYVLPRFYYQIHSPVSYLMRQGRFPHLAILEHCLDLYLIWKQLVPVASWYLKSELCLVLVIWKAFVAWILILYGAGGLVNTHVSKQTKIVNNSLVECWEAGIHSEFETNSAIKPLCFLAKVTSLCFNFLN